MAIYYVQNMSGQGRVRNLPGFRDPLVTIRRGNVERAQLMEGLKRLIEALFAAGATTVFPCIAGYPPLRSPQDLQMLPDTIDQSDSRSEEHTYELQSLMRTSYAVFCLKKKINHDYYNL